MPCSLILRSKLLKPLRIRNRLELISIRSIFKKTVYRHFNYISLFLCVLYVVKGFFIMFLYILCFLFKLVSTKYFLISCLKNCKFLNIFINLLILTIYLVIILSIEFFSSETILQILSDSIIVEYLIPVFGSIVNSL